MAANLHLRMRARHLHLLWYHHRLPCAMTIWCLRNWRLHRCTLRRWPESFGMSSSEIEIECQATVDSGECLINLTMNSELSIPPAKLMFFQVIMTTCFGMKVSDPTTPSRMSHIVRSRTSTPNRSVRVIKSRSILKHNWNKIWSQKHVVMGSVSARLAWRSRQMTKIYSDKQMTRRIIHKIGWIFYFSARVLCVNRMRDEYHEVISSSPCTRSTKKKKNNEKVSTSKSDRIVGKFNLRFSIVWERREKADRR